ncbi:hypothetical protein [Lysobacter antibioticus]|uniref:hypothetical protein n=1 Tax=Lysobacter antibioticus TaxID=84531 RepID=UPI0011400172|nr:hypothetical protein [Lysobacter antibioticus]
MTSTEPFRPSSPSEYPELTPLEVGNRVLRLLDGLKTTDGLTVDEVAAKTGIPLKYEPPVVGPMGSSSSCRTHPGSTA